MPQNNQRRSNPRRDARQKAAEQHTADVEKRLAKDIARSLAGVLRVDGMPKVKQEQAPKAEPKREQAEVEPQEAVETVVSVPAESVDEAPTDSELEGANSETAEVAQPPVEVPQVRVVDQDSVAAVLENGRGYAQFCDLALLDFASFVNPGGGYIRGAWAQEEALCAESYLYNVLNQQRDWYQENRRRNINCELYRNRALVVPAVRFERGKMHAYADVLVVAAPNTRRAREEYHVTDAQVEAAMRDRIRFVLALIDSIGREKAVLGAFGCGAFGGDAEVVARLFREELASGDFKVKQVVFAVPQARYDENLAKFQHAFSTFPAAPTTTYAEAAAARRAQAEAAAQAQAAEEDDEDEDWRKYL